MIDTDLVAKLIALTMRERAHVIALCTGLNAHDAKHEAEKVAEDYKRWSENQTIWRTPTSCLRVNELLRSKSVPSDYVGFMGKTKKVRKTRSDKGKPRKRRRAKR